MQKKQVLLMPIIDDLRKVLSYDPITGKFLRVTKTGKQIEAGCYDKDGYLKIWINNRSYLGHRLAWALYYNEEPSSVIDHENHLPHDNSIKNLKGGTHKDNLYNQKLSVNSSTGHNGISFRKDRNKYTAYIHVDGKKNNLGVFDNLEDAILAREEANKSHNFHTNHGIKM